MRNRAVLSSLFFLLFFTGTGLQAEIRLPSVLADHMVLQRETPVHLWGMADPGENIVAKFRGHEATAQADPLGRWSIYLPPGAAGGPFTLVIQGKNTITWNDVLVGDIWIASGQSNMEFPMKQTYPWISSIRDMKKEVADANYPRMRLLHVEKRTSDYPMTDVDTTAWTPCTPETVADFSAVAYFFGRELVEDKHVPIGLIETSWGGTPAEAWTSLDALGSDASLMPVFRNRARMMDDEATTLLELKAKQMEVDKAVAQGKPIRMPWHSDPKSWGPAALFNAMISPLLPLPIRGVIWYQGESNTGPELAPVYAHLFQTLIRDWRAKWGQGDFPFLFVQIANFNVNNETADGWPLVREAQRTALSLANTGMAVTIDIGDPENIHPADKQDVGHRLALLARVVSYGEDVEDSGPLFRQAVPEGAHMRIWFDHAASGMIVKGDQLIGFEVAGDEGNFVPAQAKLDGDTVVVSSAAVEKPRYVRYGWAANPQCNLYNRAGLPASPFNSK